MTSSSSSSRNNADSSNTISKSISGKHLIQEDKDDEVKSITARIILCVNLLL